MRTKKSTGSSTSSQSYFGASKTSSSGSATTAAAVSLTRFGQATFTSVRRKDANENGNYVPLKISSHIDKDNFELQSFSKLSSISDNNGAGSNNNAAVQIDSKPKVYKFFKSRANIDAKSTANDYHRNSQSSNHHRENRSPPKPLMLNCFPKQDSCNKRINSSVNQTSIHNRNRQSVSGKGTIITSTANNNGQSSTLISKSINIVENKSCEIKICGDKTIKKIISPHKVTEFIIRNNNSNVRNATVKPPSTSIQILPQNRGVRSSRRLKGIEPDSTIPKDLNNSNVKSAIHYVFDKKSSPTNNEKENKLTTTIELVTENVEDHLENVDINIDDQIADDRSIDATDSSMEQVTVIENVEMHKNLIEDSVDRNEQRMDQEIENFKSENDSQETEKKSLIVTEADLIVDDRSSDSTKNLDEIVPNKLNDLIKDEKKTEESLSNKNIDEIKTEVNSKGLDNNSVNRVTKPKKKIFSNRDRNKVEFNTKSFFTSIVKDDFDLETNENGQCSVSATSSVEKKQIDNDDDESYIKLKKIKKAHQCHEQGETEQFDEDIKYYLSGIVSTNINSMRCLSILGLTQQTMRPEFRMHLRAHDDMPRIIEALMDAPRDSNLALCTACLMFVYNQDRLTMDIDPNALSLMLELLETRSDECHQVEEKHRSKVRSLVEEMKNKGHAQYLKLDEITAGKLAMETLLGLTSKRAGDWFKTELRKMKGIDFIVDTVIRCAEDYSEEGQMIKIDRCMHVLENVSFNNVENQLYITNYDESKFISTCICLLKQCKHQIVLTNDSKIFLSAFFSILRVLTNVTSESAEGCKIVGKLDGVIELLLESLFELPSFIMSDQRFDLMVIILCLCINLAEFCEQIRSIIMENSKSTSQLCELLFKKIEEAALVEQQTDHLLESHETVQMTEAMQDNLLMQSICRNVFN
ncbi:protein wings apart-like [Sarcoptes scabiei]|nr:protein wings apart-like [Sarcoptes scabiei]